MVFTQAILERSLVMLLSRKEIELLKISPFKPTTNRINPIYMKKQKLIQKIREKAADMSYKLYSAS